MLAFGFTYQHSTLLHQSSSFTNRNVSSTFYHTTCQPARKAKFFCKRGGGGGRRDFKRRGDGRRPNRVGELIRREISPIIDDACSRAFRSGEGSSRLMVSVVDVRCTEDLRSARVKISIFGDDDEKKAILTWLRSARKEIRYELAQCVQLKYMPELSFEESGMAQAVKTLNIINMLERKRAGQKAVGAELGDKSTDTTEDLGMTDSSLEEALRLDGLDGLDDDEDEDVFIIDIEDEEEEMKNKRDGEATKDLFNTRNDGSLRR